MSVLSLEAARWKKDTHSDAFKPRDALLAALRAIDSGEFDASHAIIAMVKVENGVATTQWMQAGSYTSHAQIGLLERVKADMMRDAAS